MAVETAKRDPNYVTTIQGVDLSTGTQATNIYVDEVTHRLLVSSIITSGIGLPSYDYVELTEDATTDTWTFYTGGISGSLVATILISYTDSNKGTISSVEKT